MRHFIGAASLALILTGTAAAAEEQMSVVAELYTSQGCSACPPADKLLGELAQKPGVLALSFHVDYWDYIGWIDKFAAPAHGERQKKYAMNFGEHMVYTPQIVVQGVAAAVGHKARKVEAIMTEVEKVPPAAEINLTRDGGVLAIGLVPTRGPVGRSELHVIRFQPEATVRIGRGENAGRQVHYTNVVRELHVVGMWSGDVPAELSVPIQGDLPVAVLVQRHGQGEVLAAAALR